MNPQVTRRLLDAPFELDITHEEILADLCWPGAPPGRRPDELRAASVTDVRLVELDRRAA